MFENMASMTDAEVAEYFRSQRVQMAPDYAENDWEDAKPKDAYEAAGHVKEYHEAHHVRG